MVQVHGQLVHCNPSILTKPFINPFHRRTEYRGSSSHAWGCRRLSDTPRRFPAPGKQSRLIIPKAAPGTNGFRWVDFSGLLKTGSFVCALEGWLDIEAGKLSTRGNRRGILYS